MGRIEREKQVVEVMIRLYCRRCLGVDGLPEEYADLLTYARARLDHCKFGEGKPTCRRCPIHCYAPSRRELMRQVMRWSGPRMILYHPIMALRHLLGV